MRKVALKLAVVATLVGVASLAQAATTGYSSDTSQVLVGAAGGAHGGTAGSAGVGFTAIMGGGLVSIKGIATSWAPPDANGVSAMGVTSDTQGILFAKVPGAEEVYFGEYIELNAAPNDPQHTVFYVGENTTTALPSGEAVYEITGINNYDGTTGSLLTGNLEVDFTNASLSGDLTRTTSGTNVANFISFDGAINNTNASFNGSALANGSVAGDLNGQFFGDGAAAVAGALTFSGNRNLDTAFGGTKVGP